MAHDMETIMRSNNIHWEEEDMLGWINLFFSLLYISPSRLKLSADTTKRFLMQLLRRWVFKLMLTNLKTMATSNVSFLGRRSRH